MPALILTLKLDSLSQTFFDEQRKRYFPPERNFLNAHLTLFHQLPDTAGTMQVVGNIKQEQFKCDVTGLLFLGAGVAYKIESLALNALHNKLKHDLLEHLIQQDKQGFRPHITIQNKVPAETAKQLFNGLTLSFKPFRVKATGFELWRYVDGYWQHVVFYPFK
ncbi:2'-5' RNA ligase family protein [Mucilaginibacter limnophilus]|uniref:2'-5' RNA ligase family protein n=1 Tax=Mucilaginibacter limnophilus TaxID=1932778 RepID=A0A3S2UPK5_9SPHI|nr:2'-5' RNA ligase family protein [Mucilaginibacter limnophilus]RVU02888.1 2'-5' RNA ligase family protein [Mucilaginibacter limnophilus]